MDVFEENRCLTDLKDASLFFFFFPVFFLFSFFPNTHPFNNVHPTESQSRTARTAYQQAETLHRHCQDIKMRNTTMVGKT